MRKYISRNDIILIISLLAVSAIVLFATEAFNKRGDMVDIYVGDELFGTYPIDADLTIDVEGYDKGKNTVCIKDRKVFMISASCPDRLCMHQGRISGEGRMIVCLPNRVLIKIRGVDERGYDAVTQ